MNKKGQAAWETGRWMIKNFAYVFIFVLTAGFIFSIVSSFAHRTIDANDATSLAIASSLAECMKTDGKFSASNVDECVKFDKEFAVVFKLDGKDVAQEINPLYSDKGFCGIYKNYECGKETFIDEDGHVLTMDWVTKG